LIVLEIETDKDGEALINKFKDSLEKMVMTKEIIFKQNDGYEIKIDKYVFQLKLTN
jgi:hypothetical protein